ncbi:LysR family transcriptional regulator [Rhodobacteraceae bacterium NNCM2]|nr:LysR family transcriptional regulator [Coraliihabitans acroporae]
MPRRLPPLNALRAFEAAGRQQSFTGAAEELNVTHAAISRHVRGLEHRLGVQLFRNAARGVELTEIGAEYLREITPALDRIAEATEALDGGVHGTLRISCEPTFAIKWLMPQLGKFQDAYPDIDIHLDSTPRLADLKKHECDLAIRFCREVPEGVEAAHICASPVYPYAAPSVACGDDPADLLKLRLLHEDKGNLWCRWFAAAGVEAPTISGRTASLSTLLAIEGALAGHGAVLTSTELVENDVQAGRLRRLSSIGLEYGDYCLLFLATTARRKSFRAFRDWIIAATEGLRAGNEIAE